MRVDRSIVIAAPAEAAWDYVSDPANALHFISGVSRWEVEGEQRTGVGARYRVLMRIGSVEVGGLVEVVEWVPERELAWTSVTGVDQRGRWRIRDAGGGRTRVELRFAYGVGGAGLPGLIAERVAARAVAAHLTRTLRRLKREVEHERVRAEAADRGGARAASGA